MEEFIMKKLIFLMALSAIMTTGSGIPATYYISLNGKIECEHISLRNNRAKITLTSGKKVWVPLSEINSYSLNGIVYDKLMLYVNNKPSGKMVFMEKISERDGFTLYKYSTWIPYTHDLADFFFVYKENQYNRVITSKNCKYVLPYFGVKPKRIFVER